MTCAIIGAFSFSHIVLIIYTTKWSKNLGFSPTCWLFFADFICFADYQLVMVERFRITLQR